MTELAQHIIVYIHETSTHEEAVQAVASACIDAWFQTKDDNPEPWEQWLSGPFTKIIRRCKSEKVFADICDWAKREYPAEFNDTSAVGLIPCTRDDLPKMVDKLQVAEFNLPHKPQTWWTPPTWIAIKEPNPMYVAINPALTMSTGKTAAQVAHAELAWCLGHNDDPELGPMLDAPIYTYDPWIFHELITTSPDRVIINDAGRTEVEPGSCTVVMGKL